MAPYRDVEPALKALLRRFGPPRTHIHPEFPFWRLRHDSLWEVRGTGPISEGPGGDAHVSSLRDTDARGGFPEDIFAALGADRALALEIACSLLDAHFPPTRHADVLQAVGIGTGPEMEIGVGIPPLFEYVWRRSRDSRFPAEVLAAYGYQCAVCAFGVRLLDEPVALEAAHIRWHCAAGPDRVQNGLALCVLHRRLFDAGAFTLDPERRVEVVEPLSGPGLGDALERFDSRDAHLPSRADDLPGEEFLQWHRREVFVSPSTHSEAPGSM